MPGQKKGKIGLIIWERPERGYVTEKVFIVKVGKDSEKKKGEIFFPSKHVEELITAGKLGFGAIGTVELEVDNPKKELLWRVFYPFGKPPQVHETGLPEKGLGSIINVVVVRRLLKQFPGYKIRHDRHLSPMRRKQLARFGIDHKQSYPLEVYYRKNADYLREMLKRFKRKPKP